MNNCPLCNDPLCGCEAEETVKHYGCDHFPDKHSWAKYQNLFIITDLLNKLKQQHKARLESFVNSLLKEPNHRIDQESKNTITQVYQHFNKKLDQMLQDSDK